MYPALQWWTAVCVCWGGGDIGSKDRAHRLPAKVLHRVLAHHLRRPESVVPVRRPLAQAHPEAPLPCDLCVQQLFRRPAEKVCVCVLGRGRAVDMGHASGIAVGAATQAGITYVQS